MGIAALCDFGQMAFSPVNLLSQSDIHFVLDISGPAVNMAYKDQTGLHFYVK